MVIDNRELGGLSPATYVYLESAFVLLFLFNLVHLVMFVNMSSLDNICLFVVSLYTPIMSLRPNAIMVISPVSTSQFSV